MKHRQLDTQVESYAWLSTAYHEAGHAVAILMLGRSLVLVELTSSSTGTAEMEDDADRVAPLLDEADRRKRVPSELVRLWRDRLWIADSGIVAETEFNLLSDDEAVRASFGDLLLKVALIPDAERYPFLKDYFHRHVGASHHLITDACRAFFRTSRIAKMTQTLAEALLRARRLHGSEVIDTMLANRAAATGQRDLFWAPEGDEPFLRRRAATPPRQMRLL